MNQSKRFLKVQRETLRVLNPAQLSRVVAAASLRDLPNTVLCPDFGTFPGDGTLSRPNPAACPADTDRLSPLIIETIRDRLP